MTAAASPLHQVERALGAGTVRADEQTLSAFSVDGRPPRAVVTPETVEQVAEVLALARVEGWAVIPRGSGTTLACGNPPPRYDLALSLERLGRVLDHDVDNLTLTAEAGLTLAGAHRVLTSHHQMLCLGHPGHRRTLGGVIASNPVPPKRLLYGDVRDQVLGMRVALADGTLVRYGRKVLKNVAGYDMNKLFLGSQGLLGVIVEVTGKLYALPDDEGYALGAFPDLPGAADCAAALFRSRLLPSMLSLLDPSAAAQAYGGLHLVLPPGETHLLVGFEGRAVTVRRQLDDAQALMTRHGASQVRETPHFPPGLRDALESPSPGASSVPAGAVRLRLGVLPTEVSTTLQGLERSLGSLPLMRTWVADYGAGQVQLALSQPDTGTLPALSGWIAATRDQLAVRRGFLVVEDAPPALKARAPAWGDLGGETTLMRTVKGRFDPDEVLNPGRFLDTQG